MTFEEFVYNCEDLLKEYPESRDFEVVYAIDSSEGNSFHKVFNTPALGIFSKGDHSWEDAEDLEECNSVCIN